MLFLPFLLPGPSRSLLFFFLFWWDFGEKENAAENAVENAVENALSAHFPPSAIINKVHKPRRKMSKSHFPHMY
jgi:hypothetical protein